MANTYSSPISRPGFYRASENETLTPEFVQQKIVDPLRKFASNIDRTSSFKLDNEFHLHAAGVLNDAILSIESVLDVTKKISPPPSSSSYKGSTQHFKAVSPAPDLTNTEKDSEQYKPR